MNEITPDPDQNTNHSVPAPTNIPPLIDPVQLHKSSKKMIIISTLLLLLVVLAVVAFILDKKNSTVNKQMTGTSPNMVSESKQAKSVEQVFVNPINGAKTPISKNDFYTATVAENQYYGLVNKINADYIRMTPMAYKKSGALIFSGSELHGPEPITYFQVSKITKLQKLDPASKEDAAILAALKSKNPQVTDAFPDQDITKYISPGQFQGYFFADGSAFFAKTTGLEGTFLASSSQVYTLRSMPLVNPSGPTSTSVSLALANPEQYNKRLASDLLYWQNLKPDSLVVKAISQFQKQNP